MTDEVTTLVRRSSVGAGVALARTSQLGTTSRLQLDVRGDFVG